MPDNAIVPASKREIVQYDNRDIPEYASMEEVSKLLAVATDRRDRILLMLGWETGARVSEIMALIAKSIDIGHLKVKFITLKKRREKGRVKQKLHERVMPITDELGRELAQYLVDERFEPNERVFPIRRETAWAILEELSKLAGTRQINFRMLRHGNAVNSLFQQTPITVIKDNLGHEHISTTMIYTRITRPDSEVFHKKAQWYVKKPEYEVVRE